MGEFVVHSKNLKNVNMVDKRAQDLDYQSPERILGPVRTYFDGIIPLDPCTVESNPTKASLFFTPKENGLTVDWNTGVYANPPYGSELKNWLLKFLHESKRGTTILALLPASRWGQGYWQEVMDASTAICMVRKRVAFLRPSTGEVAKGNPYASLLIGWNVDKKKFKESFSSLGLVKFW